jgi:ribosomal protein S18 acetylase RimI-like enzyme
MATEIRVTTPEEVAGWTPYEVTVPGSRDVALAEPHLRAWRAAPPERNIAPGVRRLDLAAAEGGRLVGFVTLLLGGRDALTGEPLAYIADAQVLPEARRRGIGRRLVEAAIAVARREGMALLTLDVAEDNHAARALYESLGFATESRRLGLRLDGRPGGGGTVRLKG